MKHLRLLKDLSQKGIANELGISQAAYSKIEKKQNLSDWQLKRILEIMHCELKDIDLVQKLMAIGTFSK